MAKNKVDDFFHKRRWRLINLSIAEPRIEVTKYYTVPPGRIAALLSNRYTMPKFGLWDDLNGYFYIYRGIQGTDKVQRLGKFSNIKTFEEIKRRFKTT